MFIETKTQKDASLRVRRRPLTPEEKSAPAFVEAVQQAVSWMNPATRDKGIVFPYGIRTERPFSGLLLDINPIGFGGKPVLLVGRTPEWKIVRKGVVLLNGFSSLDVEWFKEQIERVCDACSPIFGKNWHTAAFVLGETPSRDYWKGVARFSKVAASGRLAKINRKRGAAVPPDGWVHR